MSKSRRRREDERGQIIILFVLALVVIMGFASLAIDIGVLRNANQNLWNALDAGALAGASQLPADGTNADAIARQYAATNYPGGLPAGTTVTFRCVVGSLGSTPRLSDVPAVCDPGGGVTWTCNTAICVAVCEPANGDTCNTIVLQAAATVKYNFGVAVGVDSGTTGAVTSAACRGPCGQEPITPVDLEVVVDRTSSMSGVDTTNARNAADAVRKAYDPVRQWMALGCSVRGTNGGGCVVTPAGSIGSANMPTDLRRWVPVGLSGLGAPVNEDYTQSSSSFAKAVACYVNSSTGTDLNDPITAAAYDLLNNGRSGVIKGIILMTDGQPNASTKAGPNYCALSSTAATAVKNSGIELFTIGFGLDGTNDIACPDTSGAWKGKTARTLLASMATTPSTADAPAPRTTTAITSSASRSRPARAPTWPRSSSRPRTSSPRGRS